MRAMKRTLSIMLTLSFALQISFQTVCAEPADALKAAETSVTINESISYMEYQEENKSTANYSGGDIVIPAAENVKSDYTPEIKENYKDISGKSLLTKEEGYVEWTVEVPQTAMYQFKLSYYPVEGKGSSIEREVYIDEKLPFNEARSILFPRVWADKLTDGKAITEDKNGNDIRPSQIETPRVNKVILRDAAGYAVNGLSFDLTKGSHTIRLQSVKEPMLIESLTLCAPKIYPSYEEKLKSEKGVKAADGEAVILEAEKASTKSDPTLIPVFDKSTPDMHPSDPVKLKLNCIGGDKWQTVGQWIEWEFEIKNPGFYKIGMRAIQNILNGAYSSRKIYIDDEILFSEMQNVAFPYSTQWKTVILGGEKNPYLFNFKAGKHTLRMEVTLADMAEVIAKVENATKELNTIYREILVVTGPNPDVNRDYRFDKILPDVLKNMETQSKVLMNCFNEITKKAGMKGETAQILRKMSIQLDEITKKPETIASRFTSLQSNISAVGTWSLTAKQQPLNLDTLYIVPENTEFPKTNSSFFEGVSYHFSSFISSFWNNYNSFAESESEKSVKVWVGSGLTGGRDQAQVLKTMADNYFTPQKNIGVNMQLVNMGALLPAALSGNGPDVALSLGAGDSLNYAVRNAVLDLSKFSGFDEVLKRFSPSALTPVTFNGGVYGLPETQTYPMMFYRKDILSELKLSVPQTWSDVVKMLKVLQKKQMNFGLPSAVAVGNGAVYPTFGMLLYQHGGEFYSEGGRKSIVDSKAAVDAFSFLTTLYSDYKLPVALDFINRFRTGAIPIGIADYSLHNQLSIFAPELNGLWDFAMVPGVEKPDGTIDRSVCGSVSVSIILSKTESENEAWEFVKWWTESEIQVQFGRELESIMGTAARYPTANMEALYQIPWSKKSFDVLMSQWEHVKGIPEVPGGYYTPRYIDFAFRNVVYDGKDAGEEMVIAAETINDEIKVKRKEFKLPD